MSPWGHNDIAVDIAADIPLRFQSYDIPVEDTRAAAVALARRTLWFPVAQGSDEMRAIDSGAYDVRRLGAAAMGALLCCTLAYATMSAGAKAHEAGKGPAFKCKVLFVPCIGPINTIFYMDGLGSGDIKLLWATRPTKGITRQVPKGELEKQSFVCHTAPKVKLVAVFTVHVWESSRGHIRSTHTRVPFGPHSCHITLTWLRETSATLLTGPNASSPSLTMEGKRVR
jgi:hypothetical protein